jgi:BlaI family penicillinase repressor
VLWQKHPATANEVVESLDHTTWNPRTVRTLLNRLVKKGALAFEQQGRRYEYYPLVAEDQTVREERKSFIKRVYDGSAMPMLAAFLEEEELSVDDIDRLKAILKKREGK